MFTNVVALAIWISVIAAIYALKSEQPIATLVWILYFIGYIEVVIINVDRDAAVIEMIWVIMLPVKVHGCPGLLMANELFLGGMLLRWAINDPWWTDEDFLYLM